MYSCFVSLASCLDVCVLRRRESKYNEKISFRLAKTHARV